MNRKIKKKDYNRKEERREGGKEGKMEGGILKTLKYNHTSAVVSRSWALKCLNTKSSTLIAIAQTRWIITFSCTSLIALITVARFRTLCERTP